MRQGGDGWKMHSAFSRIAGRGNVALFIPRDQCARLPPRKACGAATRRESATREAGKREKEGQRVRVIETRWRERAAKRSERGGLGMDVHHLALHSAALLRRRLLVLDAFSFLALTPHFSFFFAVASLSPLFTLPTLLSHSLSFSLYKHCFSFSLILSLVLRFPLSPFGRLALEDEFWSIERQDFGMSPTRDCKLARIAGCEERMRDSRCRRERKH